MIYDCFPFFNELDLLEIRLNHLNDYVDKFVLVEMAKTFSGDDKPFFYEENKFRYKKFADKIIHIKVSDYPDSEGISDYDRCWQLENYQRDCIMRGLTEAKDDDIILTSDLDEIPSHSAIESYKSGISVLAQKMMYYYLNNLNVTDPIWTKGTKICHYSDLLNPKVDIFPQFGSYYTKKGLPTYIRFYCDSPVENGGWHFSYLGGTKAISYKIKSFAHQEFNDDLYTNEEKIQQRVKSGQDIFNRDYRYTPIPIDESFPEYLVKNQKKYKHLILPVE